MRRPGPPFALWPEAVPGSSLVLAVFFRQAVIGENLPDEPGADLEAQPRQFIGDLIHAQIGLEAATDDERLELTGAFGRFLGAGPFGQQIRRQAVEDGVADVVVGLARLEAEGLSQL